MAHNLPSLHQDHYHSHNAQSLEQAHQQQQQPVMDDMMEQILSMPSWHDSSGSSKIPWDYSSISAGMAGLESMVALLNTNSSSSNENKLLPQGSLLDPDESSVLDGSALISHLKQQQQLDVSASSLLNCNAQAGISMHRPSKSSSSLSHANNGTGQQLSSIDNRSDAAAVSSWQQQQGYVTGIPSLPLNFGKSGSSIAAVSEALMLGKRIRDDQQPASLMDNLSAVSGQDGGIFNTFASTQVGHMQNNVGRTSEQTSTQVHLSQGQPLATVSQQAPAVARPRVRARRGQATDPHSIAERLRRERIAERMKSLQELVPNSNKTDKASMLDEIIDYVKFLQLQVKVLSMSRLGNAGAVSSFMADLPTEDSNKFLAALGETGGAALQEGISLTERQVAKLMEEDMGSAMQYLQSKGLCLMPIHLASNMNKTKAAAGSQLGPNTTMDMKNLGLQQAMASMSTGSTSRLAKGVENQHDYAAAASANGPSKSTVKNALKDNSN